MEFNAFKMNGLGNDFVIIDQRQKRVDLNKNQILKICDRSFIGCDQLIYITENNEADAGMEFYNSDGSTSGACGNGTRCVAYLLSREKKKDEINLVVYSTKLKSKILENNFVETIIGLPKTNWDQIPIIKFMDTKNLGLEIKNRKNVITKGGIGINVGNPHVIFFVDDIDNFDLEKVGPDIENHKLFPEKCNLTLAQKIADNHYKVKVWERGAGLTKACGTAACATAVAANLEKMENTQTEIEFNLGKLLILIDENKNITMKGPVSNIEEIKINI